MRYQYVLHGLVFLLACHFNMAQAQLKIDMEIPTLDVEPYHRPYVALWLETPEREPVATLAIWYEQDTWLKDLRQWWRKVGRTAGESLDAVTGATRKPGQYTIEVKEFHINGKNLSKGEYLLNIEASREEGDRSYIRQNIILGESRTVTIPADGEFGTVVIQTFSP